jgi:hypothetical protein
MLALKHFIGWGLYIISWPLTFGGIAAMIILVLFSNTGLVASSMRGYVTSGMIIVLGITCRAIGERLRRISF